MLEVNQYTFTYQDVLEALVKQAGLHEGQWQLTMSFGLMAANIGPSAAEIVPGAVVGVIGIGLQKATPESPKTLTIDAAVVNPVSA